MRLRHVQVSTSDTKQKDKQARKVHIAYLEKTVLVFPWNTANIRPYAYH